jgi:hypothetical protein
MYAYLDQNSTDKYGSTPIAWLLRNKEGKHLYEFMYILLKFNSTVYIKENGLFINSLHMLALNKKFDLKSAFLLYEIDRGMILMKNIDGKTPMNVSTVSVHVCMYIHIHIHMYENA